MTLWISCSCGFQKAVFKVLFLPSLTSYKTSSRFKIMYTWKHFDSYTSEENDLKENFKINCHVIPNPLSRSSSAQLNLTCDMLACNHCSQSQMTNCSLFFKAALQKFDGHLNQDCWRLLMDQLADWLEFVKFLISLHIIKISRSCLKH